MKKFLLLLILTGLAAGDLLAAAGESESKVGLGDLSNMPAGTEVTLGYDALVLYRDYLVMFVMDQTGYAAIDTRLSYTDGDVIPAGYVVKTGGRFSFPMTEVTEVSGFGGAIDVRQPVVDDLMSIGRLSAAHQGHLVLLRDVILDPYSRTLTDRYGYKCGVYQTFYFPTVTDATSGADYEDYYVIVLSSNQVYLTRNILYYGLGYDYSLLDDGTEVRLRCAATVLYQHGDWLFVKDRTGYGLLYGPTDRTYRQGDVIPAYYYADKTIADGEVRLVNPRNMRATQSGHEVVEPEPITVANINHGHWAHLVSLSDVTVSDLVGSEFLLTDAQGNTCRGSNTFEQPLGEGHYDELQGIVGSATMPDGHVEYRLLPIVPADTVNVGTIADLFASPAGTPVRFVEPLTAIYQNGPYLYVQDSAGDQTLIYGNQQATFTNGDLIVDAVACWSNENLTPPHMYNPFYAQLAAPVGAWTVGGHGEPVKPTPVTIGDVGADLLHHYIELKGVYRYSSNELRDTETGARLTLHNMFDLTYPDDMSRAYDVVCSGAFYYSTSWNVFPLEFKPHVPRGDVDGDYEVGLSDVNCIISALLANGEPEASLMDVNLDGEVNIGDVNNLIDIILTEGD